MTATVIVCETEETCKETVYRRIRGKGRIAGRCSRTPVRDGYCTQHHPDTLEAKCEERKRRDAERWAYRDAPKIKRERDEAREALSRILQRLTVVPPGQYEGRPLWAAVMDLLAVGSRRAMALCSDFHIDHKAIIPRREDGGEQ